MLITPLSRSIKSMDQIICLYLRHAHQLTSHRTIKRPTSTFSTWDPQSVEVWFLNNRINHELKYETESLRNSEATSALNDRTKYRAQSQVARTFFVKLSFLRQILSPCRMFCNSGSTRLRPRPLHTVSGRYTVRILAEEPIIMKFIVFSASTPITRVTQKNRNHFP